MGTIKYLWDIAFDMNANNLAKDRIPTHEQWIMLSPAKRLLIWLRIIKSKMKKVASSSLGTIEYDTLSLA